MKEKSYIPSAKVLHNIVIRDTETKRAQTESLCGCMRSMVQSEASEAHPDVRILNVQVAQSFCCFFHSCVFISASRIHSVCYILGGRYHPIRALEFRIAQHGLRISSQRTYLRMYSVSFALHALRVLMVCSKLPVGFGIGPLKSK